MNNLKLTFATVLISLLPACGGGGGSGVGGSATESASGIVMDGYLKNAFVFLDLNDDGIYNLGEPQTTTDANGGYTLSASPSDLQKHAIIAVAIAGSTVDLDAPNLTVSQQYSLTAPVGKNSVISPITTLIASKISQGLNVVDAENAVKSDLGLTNIDLYKDYIAAKASDNNYKEVHNIASATVEVLKRVESATGNIKSSKEKLALVNTEIKSTDFVSNLSAIKNSATTMQASSISSSSTSTVLVQKLKNIVDSIISITATTLLAM